MDAGIILLLVELLSSSNATIRYHGICGLGLFVVDGKNILPLIL